jgi:altronate dehydratase
VTDVLVVSARDNVATALESLEPGRVIELAGSTVRVGEAIPRGHKVALRALAKGDQIIKYGSAIGSATMAIAAGAHVHTHNVASARGRGDLRATPPESPARLAEPPDVENMEPMAVRLEND